MAKKKKEVKTSETENECGWIQMKLPLNEDAESPKL